ncbi:large conductance mechanosensitive channel protein MscL [Alicyclobacillus fodiniaquatilis]|uniref:Large-conductance mechanosensitive channel n=1 Tax=Alicyclobacillus fodiniaquatilis TaxID=1661150 RepID=A0ABW4JI59_9BACL
MWKEFKEFALRGNLVDLTIGFVIGSAFSKVATSIVNDIIMPPIGLVIGRVDFSNLYINLSGKHYNSFQAAQAAGAPTINIGQFLNTVINFIIIAIVMFIVVKQLNRLSNRKKQEEAAPAKPHCPYCLSEIDPQATRCPACTSHLPQADASSSS